MACMKMKVEGHTYTLGRCLHSKKDNKAAMYLSVLSLDICVPLSARP